MSSLDPSYLWKWPMLWFRFWVRRLGLKTVLIGMGLVTIIMLIYGWWESYQ